MLGACSHRRGAVDRQIDLHIQRKVHPCCRAYRSVEIDRIHTWLADGKIRTVGAVGDRCPIAQIVSVEDQSCPGCSGLGRSRVGRQKIR